MNDYQKKNEERETREVQENRILAAMIPDILREFGPQWSIDKKRTFHDTWEDKQLPVDRICKWVFVGPENRCFTISFNNRYLAGNKGKVFIGAWHNWQHHVYENGELVKTIDVYDRRRNRSDIGVSLDRGAKTIAKQIQTRFFPQFEDDFIYYRDTLAAAIERDTKRVNGLQHFAALCNCNLTKYQTQQNEFHAYYGKDDNSQLRLSFEYYDDSHTIEVSSLSNVNAEKLIAFIQSLKVGK